MSHSIVLIILGVFVLIALLLGLFVLKSNAKDKINQAFFLFILCIIFWIITNTGADAATSHASNLLLSRATMVAAAAIPWSLLIFSIVFPSDKGIKGKMLLLLTLPFLVVSYLSYGTSLVISDTQIVNKVTQVSFGNLASIYAIYFVTYLAISIGIFLKKYIKSKGIAREQMQYLAIGLIASLVLGTVTNLILPLVLNNFSLTPFGPITILFLLAATAYSILAHHLFDIRVIIRRTVIYTGLFTIMLSAYSLLVFVFSQALPDQSHSFITNFFVAIFIGLSYGPLNTWLSEKTDSWLFKKDYEQQNVISNLSKKLNGVITFDEALDIVMSTITKVLHLHQAVSYVFQPGENSTTGVKRVKQIGYKNNANLLLQDNDFTISFFSQHPEVLIVEELAESLEREKELIQHKSSSKVSGEFIREHAIKQAVYKKLLSLDAAIAIPLHLNTQPLGLILLSEKLNGEQYHQQDLALLELVGAQAISSIQKAKLYEGDQMKSEFVSIASHELLTPVSAIEGYLSMILEEHIGKIDAQAEDYLTKVYTSAKRLSLLIKDLLSVSRIEAGTMKVAQQQLDINKSIKDVLDQLRFIAAAKKMELIYHEPLAAMPPVWADPDRTTQILVNLVSNAIKYTPQGSVTIDTKLDKHAGIVQIDVSDTGMGMSKQAMSHLFSKFYRVDTPETTGIVGTGLGLYITKSLVEKMGGAIMVKSTPGKGSTFSFTLPIFKVETSVAE